MDNFVEEQENFDIFFLLKNQDYIKAHSDILSGEFFHEKHRFT